MSLIIKVTFVKLFPYKSNYSYNIGITVWTCSRFGAGQELKDDKAIILIGMDLFFKSLIYRLVDKVYISELPKLKLLAK